MPQDPLTSLLVNRQILGTGPDSGQALPDTLTPEQEAAQSQAPLAALRKPLANGMDIGLSAAGIRSQRPGNLPTALGSGVAAIMGGPKLPFDAAEEAGSTGSQLLRDIFAKNPKAEAAYASAMAPQLQDALATRQAAGASRYADQARAHSALLDLVHSDRPSPIPTDTGWATAIPLPSSPGSAPQASVVGTSQSGMLNGPAVAQLAKSGLSQDDVRTLRKLPLEDAKKAYPNMSLDTMRGIRNKDVYGWIQD